MGLLDLVGKIMENNQKINFIMTYEIGWKQAAALINAIVYSNIFNYYKATLGLSMVNETISSKTSWNNLIFSQVKSRRTRGCENLFLGFLYFNFSKKYLSMKIFNHWPPDTHEQRLKRAYAWGVADSYNPTIYLSPQTCVEDQVILILIND